MNLATAVALAILRSTVPTLDEENTYLDGERVPFHFSIKVRTYAKNHLFLLVRTMKSLRPFDRDTYVK
jgi:hypothetical protein